MKYFYVISNLSKDYVLDVQDEVQSCLEKRGAVCRYMTDYERMKNGRHTPGEYVPEDTQCIITIGGDGTLIQAARDLAGRNIPMLGINRGHLGFLNQVDRTEDIDAAMDALCLLYTSEKISHTGGHLASNLGVVELTIALFRTFDLPEDKIIWDVGHQSYTHKILSGRRMEFDELRQYGGLSGFPKRKESPYDSFDTGHSSTSISAGLGIAQGRDILGEDYKVVSVIGDGALTGGMAYEALNNAARMKKNFIIILNDNKMSISENVGGMSRYLGGLRTGAGYNDLKKNVADTLERIPVVGGRMIDKIKRTKNSIKQLFIPGMLFENMGITYLGPVDGHNIPALCKVLKEAQKLDHAVLVHVLTKKGKGYEPAEKNPAHFHGVRCV